MIPHVKKLIDLALDEDLSLGDITSELCVDRGQVAKADIISKEKLVVCGTELVSEICTCMENKISSQILIEDGVEVEENQVIARLSGSARALLSAERTILNFMQKLSGIATYSRNLSQTYPDLVLLDTRKTTPGWRYLEKYAVRVGGAKNHRFNLGDMILVKNNHIDSNLGVKATLSKIFLSKPYFTPVEVEVRNMQELNDTLAFPVDVIMLDNFELSAIDEAITLIKSVRPAIKIEVSGGIRPEKIDALKNLGVQTLSTSGFMTKSTWVDLSMRLYV